MSTVMRKSARLLIILALLPLLAGCLRIDSLRAIQDRPEDIEALLGENEFARIQRLLEQHPSLDTAGLRTLMDTHISIYEDHTLAEARILESEGDLNTAIKRLDDALYRLPGSTRLTDYKNTLETGRTERLQEIERRQLVSRARHFAELQQLQQERLQLKSPGISHLLLQDLNQQQARAIGSDLLACAHDAMQQDDLESATTCLQLARRINDGPEVQAALRQLEFQRDGKRQALETPALANRGGQAGAGSKRASQPDTRQQLLVQTEQALKKNDLLAARETFHELQETTGESGEIDAVKQRLETAIKASVEGLTRKGDRLYRAEKVADAIESWKHALELDPDNTQLQERLARARKVLARLEELKNQQATQP
jgi:tetratricopeptide (TPR) repeat protein